MRLRVSLVFSVISLMTLATGSEDWTGLNVDDVDDSYFDDDGDGNCAGLKLPAPHPPLCRLLPWFGPCKESRC